MHSIFMLLSIKMNNYWRELRLLKIDQKIPDCGLHCKKIYSYRLSNCGKGGTWKLIFIVERCTFQPIYYSRRFASRRYTDIDDKKKIILLKSLALRLLCRVPWINTRLYVAFTDYRWTPVSNTIYISLIYIFFFCFTGS